MFEDPRDPCFDDTSPLMFAGTSARTCNVNYEVDTELTQPQHFGEIKNRDLGKIQNRASDGGRKRRHAEPWLSHRTLLQDLFVVSHNVYKKPEM